MRSLRTMVIAFTLSAVAFPALASWYDDYDAGLAAVRQGNWNVVIEKMTAAIKGNPKEGNRVRTYGTIMINYHPYYYRGVAYMNTGRYEQAVSDFEKTSGPGPENLGSLDQLMQMAKKSLAGPSEPAPARPAPAAAAPEPTPSAPAMDPALRQRARTAIQELSRKLQDAQKRGASSSQQYVQAMSMLTDASTKNAGARSNDDLQGVLQIAESAGVLADTAMAPSPVPSITPPSVTPITPRKAVVAAEDALDEQRRQLRRALEFYFNGDFAEATQEFERLAQDLPRNGWIWAFLGASQYSQYAFETDDRHRQAALRSFRNAKTYGKWSNGLPSQYFSRRIRKAFTDAS